MCKSIIGHIYNVEWGTTKYVPQLGTKWGTKVGHIYYIKVWYIKICTTVCYKSVVHLLKSMGFYIYA